MYKVEPETQARTMPLVVWVAYGVAFWTNAVVASLVVLSPVVCVVDVPSYVAPVSVPPVITTALAFCVDIVPRFNAAVAAVTNAVVATCVVFVPGDGVGATGVPVIDGLAKLVVPEKVFAPENVFAPVKVWSAAN